MTKKPILEIAPRSVFGNASDHSKYYHETRLLPNSVDLSSMHHEQGHMMAVRR
jgi:hypothetical protein